MSSDLTDHHPATGTNTDDAGPPPQVRASAAAPFGPPWSFASLLHPITPEVFFSDYWGRNRLHIARGDGSFFSELITLGELQRYLSVDELYQRGTVTTSSRAVEPPLPPPNSTSELYRRLVAGRSMRIRRMECLLDPSAPTLQLFRDMERTLQHPTGSFSCYIAPANAIGLGPHHDHTEIFTLQIFGTKRWRLYHRVDTDHSKSYRRDQLGEPSAEFVLEPGDLFYLPRGQIHEVENQTPSFSLTFVFDPIKWSALLDMLVERLARTDEFIAPMPAGVLLDGDSTGALQRGFDQRIQLIRDTLDALDAEALRDRAAVEHLTQVTMPPDDNHLESLFQLDRLTPETVLEKRPGVAWHLARKGATVVLTLPGGFTLEVGAGAEPVLRAVLERTGPFRVDEIHDSLDQATQLALARDLVGCGLLRPRAP